MRCPENFVFLTPRILEILTRKVCEMFVYKHTKIIEYVKKIAYFLRKTKTLRVNNSRILRIKNVKFPGFYFYMNTNA